MAGIARKIAISDEDRKTLLKWKRSPNMSQKLVRRADIVLAAAECLNNKTLSERGLWSEQTVCLWRKRYAEHGIEGLQDEPKPFRPRTISRHKTDEIVATTLTPPEGMTHWSKQPTSGKIPRSIRMLFHPGLSQYGVQHDQKGKMRRRRGSKSRFSPFGTISVCEMKPSI